MGRFDSIEASWGLWESCLERLQKMGWVVEEAKYDGWTLVHPDGLVRGDSFLTFPKNSDLAQVARIALEQGHVPPNPENRYTFEPGFRGKWNKVLSEEAKSYDIASEYAPYHEEYTQFLQQEKSR